MKHAWLIIAHNEFGILQRLISMLDAPESDIYVHIDKKVKILPELNIEKGRLFVLEERLDVRWGSVSQIEVELHLMETACKNGPYAFYHILSGTHLPLKSIDELFEFYNAHIGQEVMRLWADNPGDADFKLRRYHFPLRNYKSSVRWKRRLCQLSWNVAIKFQKVLGIRHMKGQSFIKTDNWLSLTEIACKYLVVNKDQIRKKYRWSFCGDEYFIATELQPTGKFNIFDYKQLLYVKFLDDTPRTFALSEYLKLQDYGCLWARKFSEYVH